MEISKYLRDDIIKIQTELITAIQNHQVLVSRQGVSPSDNIRTQIEEVQRHIICLGESQKILVTRLRVELESQSLRENNKNNETSTQQFPKMPNDGDKCNIKGKTGELGRSLLVKHMNSKDKSLKTANPNDSDNLSEQKILIAKEKPSLDSSSEENRTPCASPANINSECELRGVKRPLSESHVPVKRVKTTLQATPRPSSPVPAANDALSSSSEESLDSPLISKQPEVDRKIEFAHSLGLITQDSYKKVINKKSERRKRRISHHHHLCNGLWDLTVLQKRRQLKDSAQEDAEDMIVDCNSPHSDTDSLCFVCRKPGELEECRVCQTGCHVTCVANVCPACTHQACPIITEKKKELELLRLKNKELHKSVAKLRERAKVLSASLVTQTATVNQLSAKEDKLHESIKKIKDFITHFQGPTQSS